MKEVWSHLFFVCWWLFASRPVQKVITNSKSPRTELQYTDSRAHLGSAGGRDKTGCNMRGTGTILYMPDFHIPSAPDPHLYTIKQAYSLCIKLQTVEQQIFACRKMCMNFTDFRKFAKISCLWIGHPCASRQSPQQSVLLLKPKIHENFLHSNCLRSKIAKIFLFYSNCIRLLFSKPVLKRNTTAP